MRTTPLEDKIAALVAPVIEDLGFSFVCARLTGEMQTSVVQIMAEDPKTRRLGVDDCAKLSRAISALMDVEDPIKGAYRLEVSSPGIDRLLITQKDFADYAGFEAKFELLMPDENSQKRFRGKIKGIENDTITILTDTGEATLPYSGLAKAKLVLTDELIKATANL